MDGLSGGTTTVAAAFFLLLAAMSGQFLVSALAAALIGACIRFLRYNLNPATIFMGDTGSLFLGFLLAALAIKLRFPSNVPWITWLVPICVLGLPIFDTTLVFISRLRRGKNPLTTPGKDHLSHRLVRAGPDAPRGGVKLLSDRRSLWHGGGLYRPVALPGWLYRRRAGGAGGALRNRLARVALPRRSGDKITR